MQNQPPETAAAPKTCPFCKSLNITTTSKEVNASTYWRCAACGQIWNAGRLQSGRRTPFGVR
jgi:transposase-like protein